MAMRKGKDVCADETAHTIVLLEQIRSDQATMLAAMNEWGERLERTLDDESDRVEQRLSALEAAMRHDSRDSRHLGEELADLRDDVRRVRSAFDIREEVRRIPKDCDTREHERRLRSGLLAVQEGARIAALEARVAEIERRLAVG